MKVAAQKEKPTTQRFIEIEDIKDDVVLFSGGRACQVIEVIATNFSLQSTDEQQAKILAYASLLNSLSFPIQITIINRRLDINPYLYLLDSESKKATNPKLVEHITHYRNFVADLVKNNDVLDKKFYITISYSYLEKGAGNVAAPKDKNAFYMDAKNILSSKSSSVVQELSRIGLKSNILRGTQLVRTFYEIYNQEEPDNRLLEAYGATHVQGGRK
jgi:hypothetical protein